MTRIEGALRAATHAAIEEAKHRPPPGKHTDNRWVFRFCQHLRSATSPDTDDSDDLEPYLLAWYDACKHRTTDINGHSIDYDTARAQFHDIWDRHRVKYAAQSIWPTIQQQANNDTDPHPELARYTSPNVLHLAKCLYYASRLTSEHTFYISQADAGRILRRSQPIGRAILNVFIADGLITQVEQGHTGKATTYRFLA